MLADPQKSSKSIWKVLLSGGVYVILFKNLNLVSFSAISWIASNYLAIQGLYSQNVDLNLQIEHCFSPIFLHIYVVHI